MAEPAPPLRTKRLLMFVTGSFGAAFVPYWLNWLRLSYPDLDVQLVVTRSAERFVSRQALVGLLDKDVPLDVWPDEPQPGSLHVRYATWPDTILVYPATYHFVSRFALGLGDSPMLLALQCTSALVGIAPALPPGSTESHGYRMHRQAIAARPNVVIVDPIPGLSIHTRQQNALVAAPLPVLFKRLEELRAEAS